MKCFPIHQWRYQGEGAWGVFAPQSEALPPTCPSQKEEMAKVSHFWQLFRFLPPQIRILTPMPHKKKKKEKKRKVKKKKKNLVPPLLFTDKHNGLFDRRMIWVFRLILLNLFIKTYHRIMYKEDLKIT